MPTVQKRSNFLLIHPKLLSSATDECRPIIPSTVTLWTWIPPYRLVGRQKESSLSLIVIGKALFFCPLNFFCGLIAGALTCRPCPIDWESYGKRSGQKGAIFCLEGRLDGKSNVSPCFWASFRLQYLVRNYCRPFTFWIWYIEKSIFALFCWWFWNFWTSWSCIF